MLLFLYYKHIFNCFVFFFFLGMLMSVGIEAKTPVSSFKNPYTMLRFWKTILKSDSCAQLPSSEHISTNICCFLFQIQANIFKLVQLLEYLAQQELLLIVKSKKSTKSLYRYVYSTVLQSVNSPNE